MWCSVLISSLALSISLILPALVFSTVQYEVHYEVDHDANCFTQGLVLYKGFVYETCGQYGQSSVRKVDPKTGRVMQSRSFGREIFAEGLAITNDKMFILTWTNKIMITLDVTTFGILGKFAYQTYNGEGWGIAIDGYTNTMVVSDGTDRLSIFKIPEAFAPLEEGDRRSKITMSNTPFAPVTASGGSSASSSIPYLEKVREVVVADPDTGKSINRINELEWTPDGYVYANLWYLDVIVKIEVATGHVAQYLNLKKLYPQRRRAPTADCLNGIAYDPVDKSLLLTGKYWPKYYTISVTDGESSSSNPVNPNPNHKLSSSSGSGSNYRRVEELRHA